MASARGRGAQVRLDGDEQAAARGALGGRLADHVRAKRLIEDAGIAATGDNADGSPGSGAAALDEVVSPGGRFSGYTPSTLPGAPPGTTPGTTPPGTTPPDTTPPVIISPNPNPPPVTAIFSRPGEALTGRDGTYVTFRVAVSVPVQTDPGAGTDPLPPVVIPPPAGSISGRDGGVILLRDASYLRSRVAPDPAPVVAVPDPTPETVPPPAATFPTGPHLRLVPIHSGVIIEYQDGVNATVRLVRPFYINQQLFAADTFNTGSNYATNVFWTDRLGYLTIQNGNAATERDIVSTDDGTYNTQIFRAMADATFLSLNLTWKVSPTAMGTPPAPSAVPNRLTQIYFEDFKPGTGSASLSRGYGNVDNTGNSTIKMIGYGSCMTQTSPEYRLRGDYGYGNGLYEFRCRYFGKDIGNGAGPCIVLWPSSDVWPGPEVDLGELFGPTGNGTRSTFYSALHWKDASEPEAGNAQNKNTIWPVPAPPFNFENWFTSACLIDNTKIVFLMDGVEFARDDFSPAPKDYANGGENHTVGLLSQSTVDSLGNPSGLECDWIRWRPTSLLPPMTLVNGKLTYTS